MVCTTNLGLEHCHPDPYDPEMVREAMHKLNRVIDLLAAWGGEGLPVMNPDGEPVRDEADNVIVKVPVPIPGAAIPGLFLGKVQAVPVEGPDYWTVNVKQSTVGGSVSGDPFNLIVLPSGGAEPDMDVGDIVVYGKLEDGTDEGSHVALGTYAISAHVHAPGAVNYGFDAWSDGATSWYAEDGDQWVQTESASGHYHRVLLGARSAWDGDYNSGTAEAS